MLRLKVKTGGCGGAVPKDYQKLSSVAQSEHQPDAPSGEGTPPLSRRSLTLQPGMSMV